MVSRIEAAPLLLRETGHLRDIAFRGKRLGRRNVEADRMDREMVALEVKAMRNLRGLPESPSAGKMEREKNSRSAGPITPSHQVRRELQWAIVNPSSTISSGKHFTTGSGRVVANPPTSAPTDLVSAAARIHRRPQRHSALFPPLQTNYMIIVDWWTRKDGGSSFAPRCSQGVPFSSLWP
ncbi:hypothetical protein Mapa_006440 [Marchantia paleacea]|nr:hypothetical protein Mapa_006440 [Marchantia paleacea]